MPISDDSIPGALDALSRRVGRLEDAMSENAVTLSRRVARIEESMQENTTLTRSVAEQLPELKEMLVEYRTVYVPVKNTGSVVTRVIKWAGGIGAAVAGILGLTHWFKQ